MYKVLILVLLFNGNLIAQEVIAEFFAENQNLTGTYLQQTRDGNYLITASKDCYTPNSTTIEGCPGGRRLIKVKPSGDTIWTAEIRQRFAILPEKFYERMDGTFSYLDAQPINYACEEVTVGGFLGFYRLAGHHLSSTGELLQTTSFNEECGLILKDYT